MKILSWAVVWGAVLVWGLRPLAADVDGTSASPRAIEFNRDIRPIFSQHCFACHGPDANRREADLRLDQERSMVSGVVGGNGGVVVPGKPERSELIARVTSQDLDRRMPQGGPPLTSHQVDLLTRWIEQGAPFQSHWSLVPPRRSPAPDVKHRRWPRGTIDRFILSRLESEGLVPSPEADRATLLRRLSFDLIGLPPTPEEVDSFVRDTRPDAYERCVDRLLDSPHFGERMAIYWLDLVRYADTVGYHGDQEHHASPYRDYVIRAFNDNVPFDRFTIEQLAGDLLPSPTIEQKIASGYNRLLQTTHEGGAQDKEYLAKYSADRVRTTASVWMGATLGCAECHDHKFDPYSTRDFYRFAAFFADIQEQGAYNSPNRSPTTRPPEIVVYSDEEREELERLNRELARRENQAGGSDEIAALKKARDRVTGGARRMMITVAVEPRTVRVLPRGDWLNERGDVVAPGVPHFMRQIDNGARRATRLDLAQWLVSADHPQTARVFVNRLWKLFFGTGISKVLDDLGSQGEWPTHPELLDTLAVEFVESGWDVKHMVRAMVTSSTYRQSSSDTEQLRAIDPYNRLLARQSRFRLPAEMIRDNALAVSGLLEHRIGGRSARPYQPRGYYAHLNFPERTYQADQDANQYRRGVYIHWQRQFLHPFLKAFDAPSREECTAERPVSNTPLAALTLLNDPTFVEAARAFAGQVIRSGEHSTEDRLAWAFRKALGRTPRAAERSVLEGLYERHLQQYRSDPAAAEELVHVGLASRQTNVDVSELAAWTSVTRAILNLNESITRN